MAGAVMYPNLMKEKTKNMLGQLDQLAPYAEKAYDALIIAQLSSFDLKGKAWESVREYMGEVQLPLMKTYQLSAHRGG